MDAQTSSKEGRLQSQHWHFIRQCEINLNTPQIPIVYLHGLFGCLDSYPASSFPHLTSLCILSLNEIQPDKREFPFGSVLQGGVE